MPKAKKAHFYRKIRSFFYKSEWLPAGILTLFCVAMLTSVYHDSVTTDEILYIPTGYRFLTEGNARIGYEHPPLIRELAGLPLLFLDLKESSHFIDGNISRDLNGSVWTFGDKFLHEQTEAPETILFLARFPMVLLSGLLGLLIFLKSRSLWGTPSALLALFFYCTSPLILAHGRLVTMDVPTALGAFLVISTFVSFLQKPTLKRTAAAGIALGVAQLIKFSMLSLIPFLGILLITWLLISPPSTSLKKDLQHLGARFALIGAIALGMIAVFYSFHLFNYPPRLHAQDIVHNLSTTRPHIWNQFTWLSDLVTIPVLRPIAHYLFGVVWQSSRSGAFGYFLGEGSLTSWIGFYPFGFLVKQPLPFLILLFLAVGLYVRKKKPKSLDSLKKWGRENFFTLAAILWIGFYLFILIFVNTGNTGSRYLMPALPFLFMLAARPIADWLGKEREFPLLKTALCAVLLAWQAITVVQAYPSFISFMNPLAGPPEDHSYTLVDTDIEWGQDVRRLASWVEREKIPVIKVANRVEYREVAGGDQPKAGFVYSRSYPYYLGQKFGILEPGVVEKGWIAVPARLLRWGQATPAQREGWYSDSYRWLQNYEPVTRIGNSIFVYHIP